MNNYPKYGLILFAVWIIAGRIMSIVYMALGRYPDLISHMSIFIPVSVAAGLAAGVAGVVINAEMRGANWDIRRVAMAFLGITLILIGGYNALFNALFNSLNPGFSVTADSRAIALWTLNGIRVLHAIAAVLILVSLKEEGSVARIGLFLYGIVVIAGIAFQLFGMAGASGIRIVLDLLGIVAGVLILKETVRPPISEYDGEVPGRSEGTAQ
jgi:hypothetical protein